jgi:hypothetical protein
LRSPHAVQSSPRQSPVPQKKKNALPGSTTTTAASSLSNTPSSATTVRLRKKSMVGGEGVDSAATPMTPALATSLARRRRSRTESLKEGVPISPSLHSATTQRTRKKSVVSSTQDTTPVQQESLAAATKKTTVPPTYTRKRGKVKREDSVAPSWH